MVKWGMRLINEVMIICIVSEVPTVFSLGNSRLWVSDGVQPRQLWFQMRSSLLSLKAYSRSSQTGTNPLTTCISCYYCYC